jgi:uncharacterized protein
MTLPSGPRSDGQAASHPSRDQDATGHEHRDQEAAGHPGRNQETAGHQRRDRDAAGRPRNSRPRDALGRPLSRGAAGEPDLPEDVVRPAAEALALAQQLVDDGRPFQAHEVLESSWRAAPPDERELWRGLAQIAVGLTHAQRGNARGAVALLRRGGRGVGGFTGSAHGVEAAGVAGAAVGLAARIERDGLAGLGPADLRLRLRGETG